MTSFTFGKLFDGLFASIPSAHPPAASQRPVPAAPTAQVAPIPVGTGASNERHLTIAGEPVLFRDEGDVVVQFKPAFDYDLRETTVGMKLIPALTPHWEVVREFSCSVPREFCPLLKKAIRRVQSLATRTAFLSTVFTACSGIDPQPHQPME